MGCYDPIEADLSRASDTREAAAAEVDRLQTELRAALGALAVQEHGRGGVADALRARAEPLLQRAFHGRFTWADAPPVRGSEDEPGGPWPSFRAVNALLDDAAATRLALERLLCDVRGALVAGGAAPDAEHALHLAHRQEDRAQWLAHARRHRGTLAAALDAARSGGAKARAEAALHAWDAAVRRVQGLDDAELLTTDALPPIPGVADR